MILSAELCARMYYYLPRSLILVFTRSKSGLDTQLAHATLLYNMYYNYTSTNFCMYNPHLESNATFW